jgi:hypothetical protein
MSICVTDKLVLLKLIYLDSGRTYSGSSSLEILECSVIQREMQANRSISHVDLPSPPNPKLVCCILLHLKIFSHLV